MTEKSRPVPRGAQCDPTRRRSISSRPTGHLFHLYLSFTMHSSTNIRPRSCPPERRLRLQRPFCLRGSTYSVVGPPPGLSRSRLLSPSEVKSVSCPDDRGLALMSQATVRRQRQAGFSLGLIYWAVPVLHLTFQCDFNKLAVLGNRARGLPPSLATSVLSNIPDTG